MRQKLASFIFGLAAVTLAGGSAAQEDPLAEIAVSKTAAKTERVDEAKAGQKAKSRKPGGGALQLVDHYGNKIFLDAPLVTVASSSPSERPGPIDMRAVKGGLNAVDPALWRLSRDQPSGLSSILGGGLAGGLVGGEASGGDAGWIVAGTIIGGALGLLDARAREEDPTLYHRRVRAREDAERAAEFYAPNGSQFGFLYGGNGIIGSRLAPFSAADRHRAFLGGPFGPLPPLPNHLKQDLQQLEID